MTIRELFELAESLGVADRPLGISYTCNDDWYNWDGDTSDSAVEVDTDGENLLVSIFS